MFTSSSHIPSNKSPANVIAAIAEGDVTITFARDWVHPAQRLRTLSKNRASALFDLSGSCNAIRGGASGREIRGLLAMLLCIATGVGLFCSFIGQYRIASR
jgi:hypothetical protein